MTLSSLTNSSVSCGRMRTNSLAEDLKEGAIDCADILASPKSSGASVYSDVGAQSSPQVISNKRPIYKEKRRLSKDNLRSNFNKLKTL